MKNKSNTGPWPWIASMAAIGALFSASWFLEQDNYAHLFVFAGEVALFCWAIKKYSSQ